jgi:hypothetical protein
VLEDLEAARFPRVGTESGFSRLRPSPRTRTRAPPIPQSHAPSLEPVHVSGIILALVPRTSPSAPLSLFSLLGSFWSCSRPRSLDESGGIAPVHHTRLREPFCIPTPIPTQQHDIVIDTRHQHPHHLPHSVLDLFALRADARGEDDPRARRGTRLWRTAWRGIARPGGGREGGRGELRVVVVVLSGVDVRER